MEELLDDVVDSLGGEPQTFLVIRDPVRGVNGAWYLRPEARRVILTYLLRNPRKTPRSQEELDELVRSLGHPSTQTISPLQKGFDQGMGGSVLMRNAALRSALRRMGVHVPTPTDEGRSGEERENPESDLDHPVHSGGASEEMRSNVSWNPEGQATEEEPRRDKRSGRDKLFGRPRQAEGPETEEQKKIRPTEEAMLARTRMEVFKSLYKRNKWQTKEMMLELGMDVDARA